MTSDTCLGRTVYEEVKRQENLKAQLLQRIQYHKDEYKQLKLEITRAEEELKRLKAPQLSIAHFVEMVDKDHAIISSTMGSSVFVRVMSTVDRELLKPNASVACHRHSQAVVEVLPPETDSAIRLLQASERPDTSYSDIGIYFVSEFVNMLI
jgi:26S proteasome regulatory subunit T3